MDLGTYSLTELQRLRNRIDTEIRRRSETAKRDLLKKMQKLAADHGMSLDDIVGKEAPAASSRAAKTATPKAKPARKAATRKTGTVAPKYRHPEDSSLTWTGRGRQPLWVRNWVESGHTLESTLINAEAPAAE